MITRKDYLASSSSLHDAYYRQFVTAETLAFVKNRIGIDKLKKSKCPHFNDIIKHNSGGGWLWDCTPYNVALLRESGDFPTKSGATCVGKTAARMLLNDE